MVTIVNKFNYFVITILLSRLNTTVITIILMLLLLLLLCYAILLLFSSFPPLLLVLALLKYHNNYCEVLRRINIVCYLTVTGFTYFRYYFQRWTAIEHCAVVKMLNHDSRVSIPRTFVIIIII